MTEILCLYSELEIKLKNKVKEVRIETKNQNGFLFLHQCDEEQLLNIKSVLEEASLACSHERSETLSIEPLSNAKEW